MRLRRPLELSVVVFFLLVLGTPSSRGDGNCSVYDRSAAEVMASVVTAMRRNTPAEFRALLPHETPLKLTSTIETPYLTESVSPSTVQTDFSAQEGVFELLFRSNSEDTFRDVFVATAFAPWVPAGPNRFIPPGAQYTDGRTFLRLGCEGKRWVVVEIGWPTS